MMASNAFEVILVGAGPVGLFLAIRLKQQGVKVAVIERRKALYPLPRAVVFDHESRRLLSSAIDRHTLDDVLEDVIGAGGQDGVNFVWRDKDLKLIADLHWELPTRSGTPFAMGFSQPELEAMLNKMAADLEIPVLRGLEVVELQQNDHQVDLQCRPFVQNKASRESSGASSPTEWTRFQAQYVVGCDGANSTIRRLLNIQNFDLKFENDWLIIDLLLKDNFIPDRIRALGCSQICDPQRPTTIVFGGKGRKRFEFMRLPSESKEELLQDDTIWNFIKPWGFDQGNCSIERKAMYTFNARWAEQFHKGRVILAGDSMHLMPPFIGQGLNSGFRDAGSLAWRLPLAVKGTADSDALFRTYQTERLSHIRALTEHCILLGAVICETDENKAAKTHAALRAHPPKDGYDPPLGKPGIMTMQDEAGMLSVQRPIRATPSAELTLFDSVFGTGWLLLTMAKVDLEESIDPSLLKFFKETLGGKCIRIDSAMDETGGYTDWFVNEMTLQSVVLIRPDFYVFGHAPHHEVSSLVSTLRDTLLDQLPKPELRL